MPLACLCGTLGAHHSGLLIALLVLAFSSSSTQLTRAAVLNNYDAPLYLSCPGNQGIVSVASWHSNHAEDRVWSFGCAKVGYSLSGYTWTGYLNNLDGPLSYSCGGNRVITGIKSYHDDGTEDRVWAVQCGDLNGATLTNCAFGPQANGYDAPIDVKAGDYSVITGIQSTHDNGAGKVPVTT
ncbi:hypothetical protein PTSG_03476 [Salpingoeca rosetta]|uniref:Ricin B lectin domain-containing protein n=1 Tax=Salpingoeca rosetta (strain ATCC 50818 / BSB-021) TaxID=946362 RepID=F2U5Q3_SALR5|nr:uncharacterized protein PTSG_03476 [Salpingoeca rosetta]EGD82844.1 hypothetical protein PTSG_03476 [Salpingoeca rosetta]|eukprot:XP_004995208.1 hypothetical protein PTSG_03476 [Salpingoeca rosetta]